MTLSHLCIYLEIVLLIFLVLNISYQAFLAQCWKNQVMPKKNMVTLFLIAKLVLGIQIYNPPVGFDSYIYWHLVAIN